MNPRQLFLLSAYRLPTTHQVMLNEDEMAAWFNGFLTLWHPALLWGSKEPPRVDSSYDHDFPQANQVFAIPHSPQLFQPDDWGERVQAKGSIHFEATADRDGTLFHIQQAIEQAIEATPPEREHPFRNEQTRKLLALPMEKIRPFFALGLGYIWVESLFDAMDHQHLLMVDDFWNDIQAAIQGLLEDQSHETIRGHWVDASGRLLSAREILYPSTIHLLDLVLWDDTTLTSELPSAFRYGSPLNLILSGETLERLSEQFPEKLTAIKEKLHPDISPPVLEICGGCYREREDALMPIESQIWNLQKGREITRKHLGVDVEIYARKRSALHPAVPQLMHNNGFRNVLFLHWDNSVLPNHRATVINWPAPDGKSTDAFTREPLDAAKTATFFNWVYHLHQGITQDTAPTLALLHRGEPDSPLYEDLLTLHQLNPIFGYPATFSRYFSDALAGEYAGVANADDFFCDYLEERVNAHRRDPVSAFGRFFRDRRKIEHVYGLAAVYRGLHTGKPTEEERLSLQQLQQAEDKIETDGLDAIDPAAAQETLSRLETDWATRLVDRLQLRAPENQPGYLLLNTCGFTRRVGLELPPMGPIAIDGPIKAGQFESDKTFLVVEIPPLGYAWIPRTGKTAPPKNRLRMAEGTLIRNEFLEAEIDPATGGLRTIRDSKLRINRLAQQLVFNPGSRMEATSVTISQNGTAIGEITTEGFLLDTQNEKLAQFKQRFRCWLGRPILEMHIEIEPLHSPVGYPWHAYYGSRFASREERTAILRSTNGFGSLTNHTRPQTPDFVEFRLGKQSTALFSGGLPFHQKHASRMLDVILIPEGEQCRVFDLVLALDRDHPMQTAFGIASPITVHPTEKGPPPSGGSAWLYQVDSPNFLLTGLKPREVVGGASRAIVGHFLETSSYGGSAAFRCVRNPVRSFLLDGNDGILTEARVEEDTVQIDFVGNDFVKIQIDFD